MIWHLGLIMARWNFGRFAGDGRFTIKPFHLLSGFNTVHAGEVGAKIDGEEAKTGHGLTAVFEDGSMIILTGNAWNYRSIVEHHAELTNAFCVPRDALLTQWALTRKDQEVKRPPQPTAPEPASFPASTPAPDGVPNAL
ncbi:MAG: hypothetical protein EKK41_12740 [Hyphomicrobiales bacterium]|nr:MAG: hypothetical protein EKK41_12740 [Hyphomicrobiales bacterium]